MKHIINEIVRSLGVKIMLRSKKLDGALIYYLLDWVGIDSNYYSLLVLSNETQIITSRVSLLGEFNDINKPILPNLRQFETKSEWTSGRWSIADVKKNDAFLKQQIQWVNSIDTDCIDCNDYRVCNIALITRPAFQYVVTYCRDMNIETITLPMQESIKLVAETKEFYEFLSNILTALGISEYFEIEGEKYE